jgi:outer membrane protein OmpA-like peptidoglycan-associated protein
MNFSRFSFAACACLLCSHLYAQTGQSVINIVPNSGFERLSAPPIGWSYKGAYFGQVVKYWFSPTSSSPDLYGPGVQVPRDWADKGFGDQKPHGGNNMAGLTLYGCINGKPHCREYVEILLSEPLVPGQSYYAEFWTTHLDKSLQIDQLGMYFSEKKETRLTDELLAFTPQVKAEKIVEALGKKWVKVSGRFVADNEAEYLIVGNFADDPHTATQSPRTDAYNYAYYYVDDLVVRKIPPFLPVPVKADDLTKIPLEAGKSIRLKSIYFEYGKHELIPRSYVELNKLLKIMQDNPRLSIEIVGHTDSDGSDNFNLDLSRRRAKAVVAFLTENKIQPKRLRHQGEGEAKPVAPNDTEEGRQLNRRVEFKVLSI